jgi:hypothetical protein
MKHRDRLLSMAIVSESTNGTLLQDKEHCSRLLGPKKQVPCAAIQYVAVFLKRLQAGVGQMSEEVDLRKETYIKHSDRPSH